MGKARQNRILEFVATRKVLTAVANTCTALETPEEVRNLLECLQAELAALLDGDLSSLAWRQASQHLQGVDAYALQKLGLWPEPSQPLDGE